MSRLDGKLAIVTGSASGIGRQIALRFAREGAKVAVADLNLGAAQEVVSEITLGGGIATAVAMNVTDEAQVEAGVDRGRQAQLGGVDILVSNAGIQHIAPLVEPPARRLAEGPGGAPRRGLPDDPGLLAAHDPAGPRRHCPLHRFGPLSSRRRP